MSFRVGTGFDAHQLVPGRPLVLGGVAIPYDRGLLGHSDGDCVLHAVCDAVLGALAQGDMGQHFPSSDARWNPRDCHADSPVLMLRAVRKAGPKSPVVP